MKDWFMSREPRERVVLIVGAIVVLAILFWWLIWLPLVTNMAALRSDIAEKSRLFIDVQRAAAVAPREQTARPTANQSLLVVINRSAESHGLRNAVTRTRQDTADANVLNVTLQGAPFNTLLSWLVTLETEHGVSVEAASISSARAAGIVNGQIRLRRL